jgi:hypothetical protein
LALLAAAIPLTNFAMAICVSYGQYAVLAAGLLVAGAIALEQGRSRLAGVLFGLALVKPQLSAPVLIALTCQGRLAAPLVAGMMAAGGWLLTAWWVGATPLQLLTGTVAESSHFHSLSHNPLTRWLTPAIGRLPTVLLLAAAGIVTAAAFGRRFRRSDEALRLVAVAVVIAMFWSYRRHYDAALMSIPLVYAFALAAESGALWRWAVFIGTGVTLWLPIRHTMWDAPWVQVTTLVIWSACLISLWRTVAVRPTASGTTVEPFILDRRDPLSDLLRRPGARA